MAASVPTLCPPRKSIGPPNLLKTSFLLPSNPPSFPIFRSRNLNRNTKTIVCSSNSNRRPVRNPTLDRHVTKANKIRFVQKLKTLLLSKPRHYLPLKVLSKCRSYLSLPPSRSILSMIKRYPAIFQLFSSSSPLTPALSVRLTPEAETLAAQETQLKNQISKTLAVKLQKLLMLATHKRLLLSKLVHLAPDLGLPPNFRSRLCNDHPDRFKTVDTSYGRALELVSWDPDLAIPLPKPGPKLNDRIMDRPPKFKQLNLRNGLNLKRKHRDFLIKFGEMPEINPYEEQMLEAHTMEAEKRACGVVREVLGMAVEKRTLVDHLTHFRKEFGLSNKVRGMLVRHPEMFYVSLKGQRDSVFLVEGYDEKGKLLVDSDELIKVKERLMELVREGKRMRRDRRNGIGLLGDEEEEEDDDVEEEDDGFTDLFDSGIDDDEWEYFGDEDCGVEVVNGSGVEEFWSLKASGNRGELDYW